MIIAIETATEVCSTALIHNESVLCERSVREKNIHSERLLILIDEVLKSSQIEKTKLEAVAVSIGPGSFTGLRIGLSAAKGLAMALHIPIIAVPSLDGIAESFRLSGKSQHGSTFCAMIDAKREEAFFAFYTVSQNDISRLGDYSITQKSEIMTAAAQQNAIVLQPDVSAVSIGHLAGRRQKEFSVEDFSYLEPLYLRDFVATMPKKKV
ncbi:MAG: tRNA (adenosine(37)-N6)-threonylcarbamoyltransferase complex dimerization subunit type 1 TsaB [Bacteroidota bacterium]